MKLDEEAARTEPKVISAPLLLDGKRFETQRATPVTPRHIWHMARIHNRQMVHETTNPERPRMGDGGISPIFTGCTKRVTSDKLRVPRASEDLCQTTIEYGHAGYSIWNRNVARM